MRTTVTLDDDVALALTELARQRRVSFKTVINGAIRAGLNAHVAYKPYRGPDLAPRARPGVDLVHALAHEGWTLSELVRAELAGIATGPTLGEVMERISQRDSAGIPESAAEAVRSGRTER